MIQAIAGEVIDVHVGFRAGCPEAWTVGFRPTGTIGVVNIDVPTVDGERLHARLARGESRAAAVRIDGRTTVVPAVES